MGKSRVLAIALLALAACGSDKAQPDAQIVIQDAPPPDMKIFEDAPPPMYDFTCFGMAEPTTADDPISIAGSTMEITLSGLNPVADVAVDVFDNANSVLGSGSSDTNAAFSIADIATGGTPINGYVRAQEPAPDADTPPAHRATYMYPPSPVTKSLSDVPVVMMSTALFDQFGSVLDQDDTVNGALLFAITDCTAISGITQGLVGEASVSVEQNGNSVGTIVGLDAIDASLAGVYMVFNVPDGETQIKASYDGMDYPTRTVVAHKKPAGDNAVGTLTFTVVRPGP